MLVIATIFDAEGTMENGVIIKFNALSSYSKGTLHPHDAPPPAPVFW